MTMPAFTTIKVTGFGETRFMEAKLIKNGASVFVPGFAGVKPNRSNLFGIGLTFVVGDTDSTGAYIVSANDAVDVEAQPGTLAGFWLPEYDISGDSGKPFVNNVAEPAGEISGDNN